MESVCQKDTRVGDVIRDARDGRTYNVVEFGSQKWLKQNVSFVMPESWCYNDSADCHWAGRVYTFSSALRACPAGWHLPTDEEWMALEIFLGMDEETAKHTGPRGNHQGTRMIVDGQSGFDAVIGGYRRPDGTYARKDERAAFWASSTMNDKDAWHRDIRPNAGTIYRSPVTKTYALSVRCVKD